MRIDFGKERKRENLSEGRREREANVREERRQANVREEKREANVREERENESVRDARDSEINPSASFQNKIKKKPMKGCACPKKRSPSFKRAAFD